MVIEQLSHALANKLLHAPTHALSHAREDERDAARADARPPLPDATATRMKPSIAAKLAQLANRLEEITRLLGPENATADLDQLPQAHARARRDRAGGRALPAVRAAAKRDLETAQEMAGDPVDARVRRDRDPARPGSGSPASRSELQKQLLPRDPNDERNIFLEIRAGTGGDESALFAGELFRMYTRYAERNRWQVEVMSQSPSDLGGYKEIIAKISGPRRLFEAQVRVRRPPRAARAGHRDPGPHPHLRLHGRGDARGRRGRGRGAESRPSCASTPSARPARAASTSTRPTRRCASRICRPASWWSARTTARSTRTGRGRWRCSPRASRTSRYASSRRRRRPRASR